MSKVFVSFALKFYAFGLYKLQDPNYTGLELYDRIKGHIRGRTKPTALLRETIDNGLLYHLGIWLYKKYLLLEVYEGIYDEVEVDDLERDYQTSYLNDVIRFDEGETWYWYLEDIVNLLAYHASQLLITDNNYKTLNNAKLLLEQIEGLCDQDGYDDTAYFDYLEGSGKIEIVKTYLGLRESFREELEALAPRYATEFADRIFHDRELCGYIAELLVLIGFNGSVENEGAKRGGDRRRCPERAKTGLRSKGGGKCANWGRDLAQELAACRRSKFLRTKMISM